MNKPSHNPPILHVQNLSVKVGVCPIIEHCSLQVQPGERLAIVGPNGAGKSTLFKALMGLMPHSEGEINLRGQPLQHFSVKERAKTMAYVPQPQPSSSLHTVQEFVRMGRYPYLANPYRSNPNDNQIIEKVLHFTQTSHLAQQPLNTLSGGERQKVLIAAALAQEPQILLLDEPTTFLDPKSQTELHTLLLRINCEMGTAILSITHDLNSAVQQYQQIIAIKAGRIHFQGQPADFINPNLLSELYETPFQILENPNSEYPAIFPAMPVEERVLKA